MDSSSRPHLSLSTLRRKSGLAGFEAQSPKRGEGLGLRVPGFSLAGRKEAGQKPAAVA